jgi:hypothetical protein
MVKETLKEVHVLMNKVCNFAEFLLTAYNGKASLDDAFSLLLLLTELREKNSLLKTTVKADRNNFAFFDASLREKEIEQNIEEVKSFMVSFCDN